MKNIILPVEYEELSKEDYNIDMSISNFPVDNDKQVYTTFIFIRNMSLKGPFDFTGCTYYRKTEFLMLYMTGNINLYIDTIIQTWISIISYDIVDTHVESILSPEETKYFINEHQDLICELRTITISIPVCAVMEYRKITGLNVMNDIDVSDFNDVNINNFLNMTKFEEFNNLIFFINGMEPKFYTKYFNMNTSSYHRISKLPFVNIMLAMFDASGSFLDKAINIMNNNDEELVPGS